MSTLLQREWQLKRQGMMQWLYPLVLFLLIITLFPLAIGSDITTLQRLSSSAVWIATLLSLIMGIDELFTPDFDNGTLAQIIVSGSPLVVWVLIRLSMHWVFSAGMVALLSLLTIPLFELPVDEALMLSLSIIVGSPLLLMLSAIASSLTLTLKNSAILVPLIALPMQLPILIFATGAVEIYATGLNALPTLALMGAISIIAILISPFAIAGILKMAYGE